MKNILIWICKIFLALVGLRLAYAGAMWAFVTEAGLKAIDVQASVPFGINMIKTDFGGPLIAMAVFLLLFVFKGNRWFLPSIILGGSYFVIRTISFFVDGSHPMIVFGIGLEAVVLIALFGLYRLRQPEIKP